MVLLHQQKTMMTMMTNDDLEELDLKLIVKTDPEQTSGKTVHLLNKKTNKIISNISEIQLCMSVDMPTQLFIKFTNLKLEIDIETDIVNNMEGYKNIYAI